MKIQSLAIMFIIIILPISMVLASYTQSRVTTISLQAKYDSKLKDATYDALKAYQLNSLNSDTSDYTNSKMRDIKASINTFFNSMSTNFATLGYTKDTLQTYIPALVYTMYDGYYIYSPYKNTWDAEIEEKHKDDKSYQNGEKLYGLKPYVYYSCRYKKSNLDVTITYSLDNYIQIQGYVDVNGQKKTVSKYGYLLSNVDVNGDTVKYKVKVGLKKENIISKNVVIRDQIPDELKLDEKSIKVEGITDYTIHVDGNKMEVKIPTLKYGEEVIVTYEAKVLKGALGKTLTNKANVNGEGINGGEAKVTVEVPKTTKTTPGTSTPSTPSSSHGTNGSMPKTGDMTNATPYAVAIILAGIAAAIIYKKKKK